MHDSEKLVIQNAQIFTTHNIWYQKHSTTVIFLIRSCCHQLTYMQFGSPSQILLFSWKLPGNHGK